MITLKLLTWIVFIVGHAYFDYRMIEYGNTKPNYLISFIIRAIAAIAHASLIMQVTIPQEWWPILIFQVTSFWIIFNPLLNKLRDKPFFYLGKYSGWIDTFFFKHRDLYTVCYLLAVIICGLSTIVISHS